MSNARTLQVHRTPRPAAVPIRAVVRAGIPLIVAVVLIAGASATAEAAWSADPALNLAVADATGDQVQPKVAPTGDGGCYVSWFDNIANGFDVRVQRLDAAGNEMLAHNGVLVADRGFSSTQDYGLDVDAAGNALLVFRDDRFTGVQITAAKIAPDGATLWGPDGVQLTNTTDFVAAPKIAGTGDGGVVVAWTQESTARLQKLNGLGTPVWGAGVTLTPGAGSYSVSDLHDVGTSDAILSFVHMTGGFPSPRHLLAQKFDASGALLWGAGHVSVFDGGSLQIGNYPAFVPDGSGGAVLSWYDTASLQLQCYTQRILADGSEAFPHNGVAVSTSTARIRVSPSAAFNMATGETFVFWVEENSTQSQDGVYGQKLDVAGNRQWTDEGAMVLPVGTDDVTLVRCLTAGTGAFVFWAQAPSFGQDRLYSARLDGSGTIDIPTFDVASTPSQKSRLDVAQSTAGYAILAWSDGRTDSGDILAQNVNADGTLGPSTGAIGDGGDGARDPVGVSRPRLGAPWPNPTAGPVRVDVLAGERTSAAGEASALRVYDASGRLVRVLAASESSFQDGSQIQFLWDGRDGRGVPVAAGVYFLWLEGAIGASGPVPADTGRTITVVR